GIDEVGFHMIFSVLSCELCQVEREMHIGLQGNVCRRVRSSQRYNDEMHKICRSFRRANVVSAWVLTSSSESNPGRDLRAMCNGIEKKPVIVVVSGERPITNFRKYATGEVNTDYAFDLPHQIGAGSEPADLAAHGGIERFVEIVAGTQSDIGSEPVIVSRKRFAELRVQGGREIPCDPLHGRANNSIHRGTTSVPAQVQGIYPCAS